MIELYTIYRVLAFRAWARGQEELAQGYVNLAAELIEGLDWSFEAVRDLPILD